MSEFSENADDDRQLLQRFAEAGADGQRAFQLLVERYSGLAFGTAMRICSRPELAEDATQNAFLALGLKANALVKSGLPCLGAWVHRAVRLEAKRLLRDALRAERRHAMIRETMPIFTDHEPPAEAVWNNIRPDLDDALGKMSDADRDILLLHYYDGLKFHEIASRLKIQPDAAQKRGHRALAKLSQLLSKPHAAVTVAIMAAGMTREMAQAAPPGLSATISNAMTAVQAGQVAVPIGAAQLLTIMTSTSKTVSIIFALILLALSISTGYFVGDRTRPAAQAKSSNPAAKVKTSSVPTAAMVPTKPATQPAANSAAEKFVAKLGAIMKERRALLQQAEKEARNGADFSPMMAQVEAVLARGDLLASGWLGADCQSVLTALLALSDQEMKQLGQQFLFYAWLQQAPAEALAAARQAEVYYQPSLFASWGRVNPKAAMEAANSIAQEDNGKGRSVFAALIEGWLIQAPSLAVQAIEAMEFDQQKGALSKLDSVLFYESKRPQLFTAIDNVKEQELRLEMVQQVARRWAKMAPHNARGWLDTLAFNTPQMLELAAESVFRQAFKQQPEASAEWFWSKLSPEGRGNFIASPALKQWTANDPAKANAWMAKKGIQPNQQP